MMSARYMSRRQLLKVMALGVAGTALAACQPRVVEKVVTKEVEKIVKETVEVEKVVKEAVEVEKEVTRIVVSEAAPVEPTIITINMRAGTENTEAPIYKMRPEELMQEHPEIKVELGPIPGGEYQAKLQTMIAAGTIADLVFTQMRDTGHDRLVRQGVIAVVDDWLEANDHPKTEWIDAAVQALSHEGKMYGLPKCCHPETVFLWLNERMFQEAGLTLPERYGSRRADIVRWSEAVVKGPAEDREVYGCYLATHIWEHWSNIRAFGGWLLDEGGKECLLDSDACWEWAQWTNHLYRAGYTPHAEALPTGGGPALFAAQKVGMILESRWLHSYILNALEAAGKPFEWRVIQAPREENANGWLTSIDTHSVTTFTKHPDEAHTVGYALADKRFGELCALHQGYVTARVDDAEVVKKIGTAQLEIQYSSMLQEEPIRLPHNLRGSEMETVFNNETQKIWLGDVELTHDQMNQIKAAIDGVLAKP